MKNMQKYICIKDVYLPSSTTLPKLVKVGDILDILNLGRLYLHNDGIDVYGISSESMVASFQALSEYRENKINSLL